MNPYQTLAKNTALISIGTFGSKILSFLMVRFYTGCLSPAEYGTGDLIVQTVCLLVPLISLGVTDGVFRFTLDEKAREKDIFSAGCLFTAAGGLLFFALIPLLRLNSSLEPYLGQIVFFTMASCFHSLCAQFVRARGNMALWTAQGLLNTALVIALNLLFLPVFRLGAAGYVQAAALADAACAVFLACREKLWRQLVFPPQQSCAFRMLRYSVPLIPTAVFWWITGVSDRYMISAMIGSEANGIYNVACKIPTVLTLISGIFLDAWQFSAIRGADGNTPAQARFFSKVWGSFQASLFPACGILTAFSQLEIRALADENYAGAWRCVPLLCAATLFASFAGFMGSVYFVRKKSSRSFWTSMLGAAVNILLNFLLIPSGFGIQGAAAATFFSYFLVFAIRAADTRKLIAFRLYSGRLILSGAVLLVQVVWITQSLSGWAAVQIVCTALLLFLNLRPVLESGKKLAGLMRAAAAACRRR